MDQMKRKITYDFATFGKMENDAEDNRVRVSVDIVIQLFANFDFGPRVSEDIIKQNKQALRVWEGTIVGKYPGTWEDIYIVGEPVDNDTIEAVIMWASDYELYLVQLKGNMN